MSDQEQPTCALCGQIISEEERDLCLSSERFNGLTFCYEHQKRFSACPAVRWQPGGQKLF